MNIKDTEEYKSSVNLLNRINMGYKTVYTKTHTLLIDNEEKSLPLKTWVWNDEDNDIYQSERDDFGDGYPHSDHVYEIIAAYPKIEGVLEFSILPPNKYDDDNTRKILSDKAEKYTDNLDILETQKYSREIGFRYGYIQAESELFNLEDLNQAVFIGARNNKSPEKAAIELNDYIETLKKPYRFIIHYEDKGSYNENGIWENKMERKVENNKIFGKWTKIID